MSTRPPLPFGLGRDPACSPHRCNAPDAPLPAPGTALHDQVASALSQLFQTFFSTSLRYLGVSEILDWLELNGTVDAWILTGLEQGRLPEEVGNDKNLEFGREAIRSVIQSALEAEDGAWATSLRETGFSSALSMAYEGIVAQLNPSKTVSVPCLHTLLTPTGLSMLKSAPLKSAFPICPPRTPPSPSPLLASIRSLIQRGALSGPAWKTSSVWRQHIRKAFAAYHAMLREIAEDLVSGDPSFSEEYRIFLENISQPLQLLQLIADDFEAEFGPGATRGLLAVGEAGGDNILSIMDFCAAKKPSELLARVKQRVAEKHERERRSQEIATLRAQIKELDTQIRGLLLDYRSGEIGPERTQELQRELEATLDQRDALKKEVEDLQAAEDQDVRERKREKAEKEKVWANLRSEGASLGAVSNPSATQTETERAEAPEFRLGSSKDLLVAAAALDPFAATAPRAVSPCVSSSAKGKGKATLQPRTRGSARYAPPPPAHRYNTPRAPLRAYPDSPSPSPSLASTPVSSRPSSPAPSSPKQKRRRRVPSRSRPARSRLAASVTESDGLDGTSRAEPDDAFCEACEQLCPVCSVETRQAPENQDTTGTEQLSSKELVMAEVEGPGPIVVATGSEPMSREANHDEEEQRDPLAAEVAGGGTTASTPDQAISTPSSRNKKKKKKKKNKPAKGDDDTPPRDTVRVDDRHRPFSPLSRYPPPKCCPPDRCTGVGPNYSAWAELDGLLYETCLAGFKYELIGALPAPLFHLRDKLAKSYLLSGGRMCLDTGEPKCMDEFIHLAEKGGIWYSSKHAEIQAWAQRVLAISLQKLVDVLRATLGDICICKMSNHLDILEEARNRLEQCEKLDRTIPIDLPEMDLSSFLLWSDVQIRAGKLSGPEWENADRQYKLADFLLAFSDAFDLATDRLFFREDDPYVMADEMITLLEWQGGVRAFETAMRFGPHSICHEFGSGVDLLNGTEDTKNEERPLQSWGRLLELSKEARQQGVPISRNLAGQEKQRGNDFFAAGEYEKAIVSFATSGIIFGTEPTYPCNAAAARMKLNTPSQYSEAVADCTLALYYSPTSIKALYRRGCALIMLGHWRAGFADLKQLEKIAPESEPAKSALKWANERHESMKGRKGRR
ncbi:hypothetical protein JCM10212_006636 [Sporobolomyces blumeae]